VPAAVATGSGPDRRTSPEDADIARQDHRVASSDPPTEPDRSTAMAPADLEPGGEDLQPAVAKLHDLTRRQRTIIVARLIARITATAALLIFVYYRAPIERNNDITGDATTLATLTIGLVLLIAMIVWQTKLIVNADYPGLRAIEALAVITPFYLIIFAASYVLIAGSDAGAFTEPLDRTASLYFTITIFATVGFGDIAAKTQLARIVVMFQMVLDLLILGLGLRLFVGAVKVGQRRRESRSREQRP
jgi:voltage-gated potassium channel